MEWQVSCWEPVIYILIYILTIVMGTITSPAWLMKRLRQTGT